MAETVETIEVRLKYSASGALAQINKADFDPEKHALPDAPVPTPPVAVPAATEGPGEPSTPAEEGEHRPRRPR